MVTGYGPRKKWFQVRKILRVRVRAMVRKRVR